MNGGGALGSVPFPGAKTHMVAELDRVWHRGLSRWRAMAGHRVQAYDRRRAPGVLTMSQTAGEKRRAIPPGAFVVVQPDSISR